MIHNEIMEDICSFKSLHSGKTNQADFEEKQEVYKAAGLFQRRDKPVPELQSEENRLTQSSDGTNGKCVT